MKIRLILVMCLVSVFIFDACAVTHIRSQMAEDPLKTIAERASKDYSVTWIDDNTLAISDWWPTHSIFSLGYTAFHANLHYSENMLDGDYYLQTNNLFFLYITARIDAGQGFFGGGIKPYMRSQIDEILGFAGTSLASSTVTHGNSKSIIK